MIKTIPTKHVIICDECGKEILNTPLIFRGAIDNGKVLIESVKDLGYYLPKHYHTSCFERVLNCS